ncbi:MAG: phospho-N-acetylmuramoyl-pentapeptide-transferase, partial [Phenylobacterium sp.]
MFYWLYENLAGHGYVPVLNLLKYQTFRTGMALFTAQFIVVGMGSRFIRWMQAKQGKGQPIRAEGIQRHVIEKAGTPTMGGVMILAGLLIGTLLWSDLSNAYVWAVVIVTAGYGVLGFLDDYAKVTKQSSEGISGRVRLVLETLIAMAAVSLIIVFATRPPEAPDLLTSVAFPFFKQLLLNFGWFYLLFGAFIIVGAANAVNFTDGLDGLATVPVMIAAAAFGLISYLVGNFVFANYLQLHFVPGVGEIAVFCGAMIGAGLGFLWYNAPPAKIF